MRDRTLTYALVISLMVHVLAVCIVGLTSSARFQAAASPIPRFVKVNFVNDPFASPPKPKPPEPKIEPVRPDPVRQKDLSTAPVPVRPVRFPVQPTARPAPSRVAPLPGARVGGTGKAAAGNPGGKLNVGSLSSHGDLGGFSGGRTPVGWVPGSEHGSGAGSGSGAGVGTPEPPKHVSEGPGTRPSPAPPAPAPPPPPKPAPEFKSRLADRSNPELIHDVRPSIPSSVEEGLSVSVKVQFTVTTEGGVSDVDVVKSSGNREIDRAAVSAASRRRYKPAVQDGVPRSVKVTVPYKFNT